MSSRQREVFLIAVPPSGVPTQIPALPPQGVWRLK